MSDIKQFDGLLPLIKIVVHTIASGKRANSVQKEYEVTSEDDGDAEPLDEMKEIFGVLVKTVSNLFRISMMIRKATPRDRYAKALRSSRHRFIDQFDINHVAEKFPKLDRPECQWLKQRLGRAITLRREYLRYCQEHGASLSNRDPTNVGVHTAEAMMQTEAPVMAPNVHVTQSTAETRVALSQVVTEASTLNVAQLQVARAEADDADNDGQSYTSVASSTALMDEYHALQLPRLQDVSKAQSDFECPLCCGIVDFKRERQWR